MFQPLGFSQHSINTSLGTIVYYTNDQAPWQSEASSEAQTNLPSLLFLHGFGGGSSAYEWSKVAPAFASNYRVLLPDLLGWGRSEHLTRNYRIEDYLTTIKELIEALCHEPVITIASSLTAAITIRVAIAHPNLFKALILSAPAGLSDFGDDYTRTPIAQIASTPVIDRFFYSGAVATEFGIRTFLEQRQFAHPERVYPELINAYAASAQQPNAEYSALSFVRGDLCFDLASYGGQLQTPTGMFWGKEAKYTTPVIGKRLAEMNPEAIKAYTVIEDVGLTPQLEQPAVTIGVIQQLMSLVV